MCIALRSHLLSGAYFISMLSIFTTVLAQADEQSLGKPCNSNFQCWRSEPVDDNGMPLLITGGLSKRLEIGGSTMRGGKCRCKDGICQFYLLRSTTILPCEEF